jgi:steroid delta-isomerase-like uncharacterized protein
VSPKDVVNEWLRAFNSGDADAMVALYAEDAVHTSPKLRSTQPASEGRLVGKEAMRRWWLDAFERLPGIRYEVVNMVSDDHVVVIEYLRHAPGEATSRVAEVFETQDGKIVRSHVYHG